MTENWEQVPFHTLFRRIPKRTGYGDKELLSVYRDYGVIIKSDRDDNFNRPGESLDDYQLVKLGDLVLNKMKTWQGSLGISAYEGIVSPAYFVYEPQGEFDSRYMHYLLRSQPSIDYYGAHSKGIRVNQWDLQPEYLDKMKVRFPPLESQQRIADYLDRETAEIDAAVADLDKYMELLEKRRSMITSDALTGADSVKLAHLVRFKNGQDWKDVATPDGEFPVYGSGGEFGRASNFLHDGEAILFGRKGTVDRPIYVDEKFWTVDTMYYAVPNKDKCLGKYIFYWATTIPFETITTNTALPSVTSMDLSQLYVPLPPLESQQRIADYLDRETAEIDSLIADSTKLRDLLLKRRSVLITEVVTGRKRV